MSDRANREWRGPSGPIGPPPRRPSRPELAAASSDDEATAQRVAPTVASTPHDALVYDSVVVPRWSSLFGRILLSRMPTSGRVQVLDVGCGTGHPAYDAMRRLGEGSRVIAIDRDAALVDLARRRALDDAGTRIFFKVEPVERLSCGDEVFDLVIGNLVLGSLDDETAALGEIRRVLVPGGRVLLTRTLAGTFEEVLDMLRDVALRHDAAEVTRRIEVVAARYPSGASLAAQVRASGFTQVDVSEEELRLPFRNARELFGDALLRVIAMPEWRWICGMGEGAQELLGEAERTLDTYFGGGPVSLTVRAGVVEARTAS